MDTDSLAREVAKWLVKSAIAMNVGQLAATTADNYTRFDKDSKTVKLGAGALGMVVSAKLAPVTDNFVDKTADYLTKKRTEFKTKKNAKKKD